MTSAYWVLLLLLIPTAAWFVSWLRHKEITTQEWLIAAAVNLGAVLLVFLIAAMFGGADSETWSGKATKACHTPWWRAEWEEWVPPTYDEKGNQTGGGYWVTRSQTHHPKWWLETEIGEFRVDEAVFNKAVKKFGIYKEKGYRPDFDRGDRYDYFSDIVNEPGLPEYPVHRTVMWNNPLKGTDSIHLGREIGREEAEQRGLFEYPTSDSALQSGRVIGTSSMSTRRWDQLNATLGPVKRVNLILIDFDNRDMSDAVLQRDYWRNGRKNDLVLCYGNGWAYVFGWSKSALVKEELQAFLMSHPVTDEAAPGIEAIVKRDFEPYDWEQHKDTPRPVPLWAPIVALLIVLVSQIWLWIEFHGNLEKKCLEK